jgi:chromosome segregation protein
MIAECEDLFPHGARWVRADFHMHTVADDEFERPAAGVNFASAFVDRMGEEQVGIGVITNHNKFDQQEFKSLRKVAVKAGVFLLPGVEIEVQGGKGVHLLVVFDPEKWIWNKENEPFIERFLDGAFDQIPNRATKDTACNYTVSQLLEALADSRKHGRDSFVVAAHVDRDKGIFKELGAGIRSHYNDLFSQTVLGFQRVEAGGGWRNLGQWLGDGWCPARVEGSDCKSLDTVGRPHVESGVEKRTWIKVSDFSFAAVKMALLMKEHRLAEQPPKENSAAILSVTWTGADGLLDGRTLRLSRDLNNIIGIRGSGKSSVLECLRDVLDLRLSGAEDASYKEGLVHRTLGSGGKMVAEVRSREGIAYRVERILGESAKIFRDRQPIPNLKVSGILTARYFGQKDLAKFGEKGFQRELIERFTGGADPKAGRELLLGIEQRFVYIRQAQTRLQRREEVAAKLAQIGEDLEQFAKLGLEKKLKEQIALDKDLAQSKRVTELAAGLAEDIGALADDHEGGIAAALTHSPSGDGTHYAATKATLDRLQAALAKLKGLANECDGVRSEAEKATASLEEFLSAKKDEFAEQRRNLHIEGELRADTFVALTRQKQQFEAERKELDELEKRGRSLHDALRKDLIALQQHWQEDHQRRLADVQALNKQSTELQINLSFKGDKDAFVDKLKAMTTGLQRPTLEKVARVFPDGIELFFDLRGDAAKLAECGLKPDQIAKLRESLDPNLGDLVTWRPPDAAAILYNKKPLQEHSLGQRATALMLFLLAQQDYDILIVDQPEDDLDNQTLYNEVITRLLAIKGRRQVIFATHSPNIPVLGDADQIVVCRYDEDRIGLETGGIDRPAMQQEIIDVMEGGKEAFNLRKTIYSVWKPLN